MPLLRIQLLGEFQVHEEDRCLTDFNQARLLALLAYLALQRDAPHARQHLAFLFWPDSNENQALTNLRKQLLFLRRRLPDADNFLHVSTKAVQWNPAAPFSLDVAEFEQALTRSALLAGEEAIAALQAALTFYHGDLLPNCYDDWIAPKRAQLREQYSAALERLVLLLEDRRDYAAAIR